VLDHRAHFDDLAALGAGGQSDIGRPDSHDQFTTSEALPGITHTFTGARDVNIANGIAIAPQSPHAAAVTSI
jgi:hypothetical protein